MIFDDAIRSGSLSQSDLAVVDYIARNPQEVVRMTARELAAAAFVSPSTVVRLCKKAGFKSFGEMKVLLAREQADEESYGRTDADFPELGNASTAQVIERVSSLHREAVRKTERLLTQVRWEPIVAALDAAEEICVCAAGYSLVGCAAFVRDMRRLGRRIMLCEEDYQMREWASACPRGELFVFVSYSGYTWTSTSSRIVAKRGLSSIAVTQPGSDLARNATWTIPLALTERIGANDRMSHFQSVESEMYALDTLYALWFSRDYAKHAREIVTILDRQGARIDRSYGTDTPILSIAGEKGSSLGGGAIRSQR